MTPDEAGRLREARSAKGNPQCKHSRLLDYIVTKEGKRTGELACKECGTILPDERHGTG